MGKDTVFMYSALNAANIIVRTIAGFLPVLPMMALYHAAMLRKDRKNGLKTAKPHIAAVYIFCFVIVLVLSITSVPGIYNLEVIPNVNFVPFAYIHSMYHQYMLNVLLFVPVGFLLPLLWKKFERWHIVLFYGFFFSLSIEMIQLFNERVSDVDDLLMNSAGTMIGYVVFLLIRKALPKVSVFAIADNNHWKWEPYCCFCFVWISMLFIRPFLSNWLLGLVFPFITGAPG